MEFIKSNDFKDKRVALFGTSGGGVGTEIIDMKEELKEKGALLVGGFFCKGQTFFFFSRGHPDEEDLLNAKRFVEKTTKKYN